MKDKFATKIGGRRMEYMVNKQLGCVDVILKNGLFRKTSYGDCIFKSESGEIDKFIFHLTFTHIFSQSRY